MASRRNTILLTLIQCGQTTWDTENRVLGASDLPLSDHGRSEVTSLAAGFVPRHLGVIHHPPDEAAADTARVFADAHGVKTKAVEELADPHLGLLEGLTERVFQERMPTRYKQWQDDPLSLAPPEGEEMVEARSRLLAATARVLRRPKSGEVGIVLHGLGLGFLRGWLADRPGHELRSFLEQAPAIERYALTAEMVKWLDDASTVVASGA